MMQQYSLTQLGMLEAGSIHIIREVAAQMERPAALFSGGKNSLVVLHLARRAFAPAPIPFPIVHIDTGLNFPEILAFRDRIVEEWGLRLIVGSVPEAIARGEVREEPNGSRNRIQTPVLLRTIEEHGFTAMLGGARRDEEKEHGDENGLDMLFRHEGLFCLSDLGPAIFDVDRRRRVSDPI